MDQIKISEVTRRNIADAIILEKIDWSGRLDEQDFLSRIFDLSQMGSKDSRFRTAARDIFQHRVNNPNDWEDDWIFYDNRFELMSCEDEVFLTFLCETLHPIVQSDQDEVERMRDIYNKYLSKDGFEIIEKTQISCRPVFIGRHIGITNSSGVESAKETFKCIDGSYVSKQITRMELAVKDDPDLAIGTAKELIETCCKTILHERKVEIPNNPNLPKLVKLTARELSLTPEDIPDEAKASEIIKSILGNLSAIPHGMAELRNQYGTGHGKHAKTKGLTARHAKLAVGAASTLAVFLFETHQFRSDKDGE